MKITFLGTRGYIDARTRRHYRHASTLITYRNTQVMIDCGIDWGKKVWDINPTAIIITHGHPDHAWGLKNGSPCPVYATPQTWSLIKDYPIENRHVIHHRQSFSIGAITIEPFNVVHSIKAPAVGYRITAGKTTIFCVHDVAYIPDRAMAFKSIVLYIGDGATLVRPMIRRKNNTIIGHASMSTQLTWCKKEKVPEAIFTHCGSHIVAHDGRVVRKKLNKLAKERGVKARIAYDGMVISR